MQRNAPLTGFALTGSGKTLIAIACRQHHIWRISNQEAVTRSAPADGGGSGPSCTIPDNDVFAWVKTEGFNTVVNIARLTPANAAAIAASAAARRPGPQIALETS